jgi:hypothetical protein
MSNEQINEKYGIEPIMREMWVWDDDVRKAGLEFVFCKDNCKDNPSYFYPYFAKSANFKNASETNPNEPRQPKMGDMGYFWDDDRAGYAYGVLDEIDNTDTYCYESNYLGTAFMNFSHEKQPWMK